MRKFRNIRGVSPNPLYVAAHALPLLVILYRVHFRVLAQLLNEGFHHAYNEWLV